MVTINIQKPDAHSATVSKLKRYALGLVVLFMLVMTVQPIFAAGQRVVDQAGLFSSTEIDSLTQQASAIGQQYGLDLVVVTTTDAGGKSARDYADDFYDQNGYGVGEEKNGILFLLDLDNREAYISTSGIGIKYLTDQRIELVLDDVFASGLTDGDYFSACQAFLTSTENFLAQGIPAGQYSVEEQAPNTLTWPEGLAGLGASGVSALAFALVNKRRYKGFRRPGIFDYHRNSLVSMGIITDNLVNTRVTSRPLPRPTNTGGPGSGAGRSTIHRSGGGGFHGGGGRKF